MIAFSFKGSRKCQESRGAQTCLVFSLVCAGQATVYGFARYSYRGYVLSQKSWCDMSLQFFFLAFWIFAATVRIWLLWIENSSFWIFCLAVFWSFTGLKKGMKAWALQNNGGVDLRNAILLAELVLSVYMYVYTGIYTCILCKYIYIYNIIIYIYTYIYIYMYVLTMGPNAVAPQRPAHRAHSISIGGLYSPFFLDGHSSSVEWPFWGIPNS